MKASACEITDQWSISFHFNGLPTEIFRNHLFKENFPFRIIRKEAVAIGFNVNFFLDRTIGAFEIQPDLNPSMCVLPLPPPHPPTFICHFICTSKWSEKHDIFCLFVCLFQHFTKKYQDATKILCLKYCFIIRKSVCLVYELTRTPTEKLDLVRKRH